MFKMFRYSKKLKYFRYPYLLKHTSETNDLMITIKTLSSLPNTPYWGVEYLFWIPIIYSKIPNTGE